MRARLWAVGVILVCVALLTAATSFAANTEKKPTDGLEVDQTTLTRTAPKAAETGETETFDLSSLFKAASAGGCHGWCNSNVCECTYYDGDIECCFIGCDLCWMVLDQS